jgi:hypothetical protein
MIKKLYLKFLFFIADVVDTAEKHAFAIISENFQQNLKRSQWRPQGQGDNDLWKKPEVENLVSDSI